MSSLDENANKTKRGIIVPSSDPKKSFAAFIFSSRKIRESIILRLGLMAGVNSI